MKTYTIYEAKTNFSQLVKLAVQGEQILVGPAGNAVVKISSITPKKPKSLIGLLKGKIVTSDDFDEYDKEIAKMFYAGMDEDDEE